MGDRGAEGDQALMNELFAPAGLADPHAAAARVPTVGCRYAVVNAVLRDPTTRAPEFAGGGQPMIDLLKRFMARIDGPRHQAVRSRFARVFTPRRAAGYADLIAARANRLLDELPPGEPFDLVARFARPLPFGVIADVMGIEPTDRDRLEHTMDRLLAGFAGQRDPATAQVGNQAAQELLGFFDDALTARAAAPRDDLLSTLALDDLASSARDDLLANCIFFVLAGHATTTTLLAAGAWTLISHHGTVDRLVREPDRWPATVEELLRYVSPETLTGVRLDNDVVVGEHTLAAGPNRLICFAAANRDASVFPDPDRFDPDRDPNPHLAFSVGPHHCLGAPLARLHGTVGLRTLFERFPSLHFVEPIEFRAAAPVRQVGRAIVAA